MCLCATVCVHLDVEQTTGAYMRTNLQKKLCTAMVGRQACPRAEAEQSWMRNNAQAAKLTLIMGGDSKAGGITCLDVKKKIGGKERNQKYEIRSVVLVPQAVRLHCLAHYEVRRMDRNMR